MPKSTTLSQFERGVVQAHRENGLTIREIASRIGRSKTVVHNFLKLGEKYATIKRKGRPALVSERAKREIKRLAINRRLSPGDIRKDLNLSVSKRRVQQILSSDKNTKYGKSVPVPRLLPRHKKARLEFAEKYQFWEKEWENVVFSDEKKFNLDGPDGSTNCWQDVRRERPQRESRNFGGGTLMIWAGFSLAGKTPMCFISTRMNSDKYVQLLDEVLIPFAENIMDDNMIFQQDNAACHSARNTQSFLANSNISVLEWPACSPDLNPIENVWSLLSRNVFKHGRMFDTVLQLRTAIVEEWSKLDNDILKTYINSMPRRLMEVIKNKGGGTHY